jgi:hypothetical protein
MQWFLELLEELGIQCRVGHPAKIRAKETRKQKHDRRDDRSAPESTYWLHLAGILGNDQILCGNVKIHLLHDQADEGLRFRGG